MSLIQGATIQGANILGRFTAMPNEFASLRMDLDFLDTGSITLDGSNNIETILDLTSENRDFTQSTASSRPAFIAGVGAQFVDDFLIHAGNLISDSEGTITLVIRFDRLNTDEFILGQGLSSVLDGDEFAFRKNQSLFNNTIRSVLSSGNAPGIQGNFQFTSTTPFYVVTFKRDEIYVNTTQQDLTLIGTLPTSRWFDDSVSYSDRITIGKRSGSGLNYARVTIKRVSYFNTALTNTDIIKLTNGLKNYYNI